MANRGLNDEYENLWQFESLLGFAFTFVTPHVTISAVSEIDFVLISNPSSKLVKIERLVYIFEPLAEGKNSDIKIYRDPTVTTNGTSVTVSNVRKGQAESSGISVYHSPTISDRGTRIYNFGCSNGQVALESDLGMFIEPNEKWLATVETNTGNREHALTMRWVER